MYSDTSRVTFLPKSPVTNVQSITPPSGIGYATNATQNAPAKIGFLGSMALLMVVAISIGSVGVFLYQKYYERQRFEIIQSIKSKGKKIDAEFITKADILNRRLKYIKILLSEHPFVTPIMADLEKHTLPDVQFDSFKLEQSKSQNSIQTVDAFTVELNGKARSYEVIAQQSDEFAKSEHIKTHFFSDFKIDKEKNNIGFMLTVEIPKSIVYAFPSSDTSNSNSNVQAQNNVTDTVNPDITNTTIINSNTELNPQSQTTDEKNTAFTNEPVQTTATKTKTTTTTTQTSTTGSGGATGPTTSTTTKTPSTGTGTSGSSGGSGGTLTPGGTTTGSVGFDKKKSTKSGSGSTDDINKNSFIP